MAEIVDFLEYKKKIEQQELDVIESLQKELREIIADMGGVHTVPMMIFDNELITSPSAGFSWALAQSHPDCYIDGEDEEQ